MTDFDDHTATPTEADLFGLLALVALGDRSSPVLQRLDLALTGRTEGLSPWVRARLTSAVKDPMTVAMARFYDLWESSDDADEFVAAAEAEATTPVPHGVARWQWLHKLATTMPEALPEPSPARVKRLIEQRQAVTSAIQRAVEVAIEGRGREVLVDEIDRLDEAFDVLLCEIVNPPGDEAAESD